MSIKSISGIVVFTIVCCFAPGTAQSDVLCAKNAVTLSVKNRQTTVKPSAYLRSATATCPRGYRAVYSTVIPTSESLTGGTLTAGETLTGYFNLSGAAADSYAGSPISFAKALASAPAVEIVRPSTPGVNCAGTSEAPTAPSGYLCIYEVKSGNLISGSDGYGVFHSPTGIGRESSRFGAALYIYKNASGQFYSWGTWAVTGN